MAISANNCNHISNSVLIMRKLFFIIHCLLILSITNSVAQMAPHYLVDSLYFADPSAHVFGDKIYIYPSHDIKTDKTGANGDHYDMKDYHVLVMNDITKKAKDLGVKLEIKNIPWGQRQLWAPDCTMRNGKYYLYFPLKDKNDLFKIGVAIADRPEGPFKAEQDPMMGSYSIDPAVFGDKSGEYYIYFGGLKGGQLQRYRQNVALECGAEPASTEPALCPMVAKLTADMKQFAEAPREVLLLDKEGKPLLAGDKDRRFYEGAWVHHYQGKYYFSYSTGTTHLLNYAIGDCPYGPFVYQGVLLTPVVGWTTHHSIIEFKGKWYLFYHDSKPSGGVNHLRSIKVRELTYNADGTIQTLNGQD